MADPITTRLWRFRFLYLLITSVVIFIHILPTDLVAGRWPGPDILVALAFAWVMRQPEYIPTLLVALVMLTADMLFLRPPGLWAGLVILGLEFLRSREYLSRDLPFLIEWAMVSGVLIAMTFAYRVTLVIFAVDQPSFGLEMIQLVATIISYPVIIFASRLFLGVRKIAPGEVDTMGHRL